MKLELNAGERCPRCMLEEQIERQKNPDYTANDYQNICVFIPNDPACDHNRKCRACGLTFRKEDHSNQSKCRTCGTPVVEIQSDRPNWRQYACPKCRPDLVQATKEYGAKLLTNRDIKRIRRRGRR